MNRRFCLVAVWILVSAMFAACGGDGGEASCADTTCLREALANAKSGDTVQLESGTYSGSFEVPAGVHLKGSGGNTLLTFEGDAPVLSVSAEGGGATLSELTIQKPACPFQEPSGVCSIYPVRPKQCATWPFWEENLASEEVWNGPVAACCPGIGRGPLHPREEIERIARETEAWYDAD